MPTCRKRKIIDYIGWLLKADSFRQRQKVAIRVTLMHAKKRLIIENHHPNAGTVYFISIYHTWIVFILQVIFNFPGFLNSGVKWWLVWSPTSLVILKSQALGIVSSCPVDQNSRPSFPHKKGLLGEGCCLQEVRINGWQVGPISWVCGPSQDSSGKMKVTINF